MTELVNFSVLNPEGIVQLFEPEFQLDHFIADIQGRSFKLIKSPSLVDDLQIYILLIGVASIFVAILLVLLFFPCCRKFTGKKLKMVKEMLIWNGIIKSVMVSYISIGMAAFV